MTEMNIGGLTVQIRKCDHCDSGVVVHNNFRHLGHISRTHMFVRSGAAQEVTRGCPAPGQRGLIVRGAFKTDARMRAIRTVVSDEIRRREVIRRRTA